MSDDISDDISNESSELLRVAVELAEAAGRRTLRYFQTGVEVHAKADGTPVTRADREAEELLRQEIRRRFPDDAILGEEQEDEAGTSGRTWILDPIDGTKAFVHGVPLYSVLVAVARDAGGDRPEPEVGVIHLPALEETLSAHRGGGVRWSWRGEERPGGVSNVSRIADAFVTTSDFPTAGVDGLFAAARLRRTWGDAYGYALVATGRADVMVDPVVEPWDIAAVIPIIEEAGGRFTSTAGARGPWHGSGLATNGHLHDEALRLLAS